MSSMLELIARRRRASASRRLGPPPDPAGELALNGSRRNGSRPESLAPVDGAGSEPGPPGGELEQLGDFEQLAELEQLDEQAAREPRAFVPPRYESWLPPDLEPFPDTAAGPIRELEPEPTPQLEPGPQPNPPVEPGPAVAGGPSRPGFAERGRMRRRVRYLRQLREVQLRDIGGFALELHRLGRSRPELVRAKLDNAAGTDAELRALERALDGSVPLRELREPGIGGACASCGAVHGSADRFCSHCGGSLHARGGG
jgi:hypothetical protein